MSAVSHADLERLSARAPHLTDLACTLREPSSGASCAAGIVLPRKLVRLVVRFAEDDDSDVSRPPRPVPIQGGSDVSLDEARWAHYRDFHVAPAGSLTLAPSTAPCRCRVGWVQQVLNAASERALESLSLTLPSQPLCFGCLRSVPSLRSLNIRLVDVELLDEELEDIRSLHWLTTVHIDGITGPSLQHLLRTSLQWTRIAPLEEMDSAAGESIATLSLQLLQCNCVDLPSWIPRLAPTLTQVELRFTQMALDEADTEQLCADLCSLTRMTRLKLDCVCFKSAHLSRVLQSMPQLRHLTLAQL